MTNEEKKALLLKDICGRLPYGVKYQTYLGDIFTLKDITLSRTTTQYYIDDNAFSLSQIKPYLRPMSSMTEAEIEELKELTGTDEVTRYGFSYQGLIGECFGMMYDDCSEIVDWLNAHHFDYRDLIPMGLALEAPKGMYK